MKLLNFFLYLMLLVLLFFINFWAVEDCVNWLDGENILEKFVKMFIIQFYDFMCEEDECFFCFIDYYWDNYLMIFEYKQFFYNFMG